MMVTINGVSQELEDAELSVVALLERLDVGSTDGVAVAKNFSVVPRSLWATTAIAEGDEIEIVRATQGG